MNKKETGTRGKAKGMPLTIKGRRVSKDYLIEHGIIEDYFVLSKEEKSKDCVSKDTIERQAAIDLLKKWSDGYSWLEIETDFAIEEFKQLPAVQSNDWMEKNKDKILQAGKEGREYEFRIGGRLFAIREKAQ